MVHGLAIGGDGVTRASDGRVVFVPGALPGDEVVASWQESSKRWVRGELLEVVIASPARLTPPCPELARGCGGCGWQHFQPEEQRAAKRRLVADALTRLGHIDNPSISQGPALAEWGYRTTVRVALDEGRAAFRKGESHELVTVSSCAITHPALVELLAECHFGDAEEVTLRVGGATGERLVSMAPPSSVRPHFPADVAINTHYHDVVAGRQWRISAESFFQTRTDGAELLVTEVAAHLAGATTVLDAYGGVGLLAAAAPLGARITSVEAARSSSADAAFNLADLGATVVNSAFERWHSEQFDAVVADPARRGLQREGVDTIAATGASKLLLVSCDAASLGRDAFQLYEAGYDHLDSELLDFFPHTPHVEVLSEFRLSSDRRPVAPTRTPTGSRRRRR